MKKITYLICSALLASVLAGCDKNEETVPVGGDAKDPVLSELTETSINGTALGTGVDLAGVITDEKSGKGIAGIAVTDGYQFVKTDANGVYQMTRNQLSRNVYMTVPAEYQIPLDETYHLPMFYSPGIMTPGKAYRCDFKLKKLDAPETDFTILMIGDPQCQVINEAARFLGETIPDIRRTMESGTYSPNVYALTLGDITFDSFYMFDPMVRTMKNIVIGGRYLPIFNCTGNHDHNSRVKASGNRELDDYNSMEEYVKHFGPTDYSFDRGNTHIVVMDNVLVSTLSSNSSPNSKTWNYTNELTDTQMDWLRQDIANVENPESKLILFCTHQPLRSNDSKGHYAEVMKMLSTFAEAHIMVGHTHYTQNYIHKDVNGKDIYEHIHGAACGAWWSSNSNVTGAPNGYNIYRVNGNKISDWILKPTNRDAGYQMRIYDGNQEFGSENNPETTKNWINWYTNLNIGSSIKLKANAAFKNSFVAEVFDDDDTYWTLEFWQNGQKVGDFTRANAGMSNMAICAFWYNDKGKNTDTWCNSTASHYWYYTPESGNPSEEQNWEVRAVHNFPNGGSMEFKTNRLTTDYSEF